MKNKSNKSFSELLLMILEELLVLFINALYQCAFVLNAEYVGEHSAGFLSVTDYSVKPWIAVLAFVMFTVVFIIIWERLLSNQFRKLFHLGIGWLIVSFILSVIAVLGIIAEICVIHLYAFGFFGGLEGILFGIAFLYPEVLVVIYPLIRTIITWQKNRNRT